MQSEKERPKIEKIIDITNRAVADYGFRQAVMKGSADIGRRWQLSADEQAVLDGPVVDALAALPVRVLPTNVPTEKGRLADLIRAQFSI